MKRIVPVDLDAEQFAPYGVVHTSPEGSSRSYFDAALTAARPNAWPSFSLVRNVPIAGAELTVTALECHAHSSQTFVPMVTSRWLVVVAPDDRGRPDGDRIQAFIATQHQAITYAAGTWHLGLHVLDHAATHAIFMWRDGTQGDETFCDIVPVVLTIPDIPALPHYDPSRA